MSNVKWVWLRFDSMGERVVSCRLEKYLIAYLRERYVYLIGKGEYDGPVTFSDIGEPSLKRPWERLTVCGLCLEIPRIDIVSFLEAASKLSVKYFTDKQPYYKLCGSAKCLIFTPKQKAEFERVLRRRLRVRGAV